MTIAVSITILILALLLLLLIVIIVVGHPRLSRLPLWLLLMRQQVHAWNRGAEGATPKRRCHSITSVIDRRQASR